MDMYAITAEHPLLGILRNVPLEKTIDYADAAVRGGVAFFEVALNSPHALEQITMLRKHFGDRCLIGGGTACLRGSAPPSWPPTTLKTAGPKNSPMTDKRG